EEDAQLLAVGEKPDALVLGEKHALGDARRAEAKRASRPVRRVEIGARVDRPRAQTGAVVSSFEEPAAVLVPFARTHRSGAATRAIPEALDERLEDVMRDARLTAPIAELAKLPPVDFPKRTQLAT